MKRNIAALVLLCASCLLAPLAASAVTIDTAPVTIDTVPVGYLGNANDPSTGNLFGGVSYAYRMGTAEVTVGQYTAFLNAVAAADTHSLYNPSMATNLNIAGIAQSGVSGSYTYSVIGSPNKPITYVSWGDAARFANWLHNGQPTGAQSASTTEDGAYTLNGAITNAALGAVSRNAGAAWFIPSENEWYKAAYYQPAAQGGDADNYWAYPTRSNSAPYSAPPPGSLAPSPSNTANFLQDDGLPNAFDNGYAVTGSPVLDPSQNYLTDAGAYTQAGSFFGTFDQGGNVYEWNEALTLGSHRGLRGGSWYGAANALLSSEQGFSFEESNETFNWGFRVATVPEPSSFVLAALGLVGLFVRCWRRTRPG